MKALEFNEFMPLSVLGASWSRGKKQPTGLGQDHVVSRAKKEWFREFDCLTLYLPDFFWEG